MPQQRPLRAASARSARTAAYRSSQQPCRLPGPRTSPMPTPDTRGCSQIMIRRTSRLSQNQARLGFSGMHGPRQSDAGAVLVVVPCLNEAAHIEPIVTKLAAEADRINLRIVVADGGSPDGTRAIINRLADMNHRIASME